MADKTLSIVVSECEAGRRLDAALKRLLPGVGLRGRRRACDLGQVLVNGRERPSAYKVRPGDALALADPEERPAGEAPVSESLPAPCALRPETGEGSGLAALFKPAGMHSEALAGKPGTSLGSPEMLAALLPGAGERARLLNRLDCATSGIVMAALNAEGERRWKAAQDRGLTRKYYLALLQGCLEGERLMKLRLILKGRERVLVEMADHPDVRRHTLIVPLARLAPGVLRNETAPGGEATLAGCLILKGARHQIRAHAAALGHPLLGDTRYGTAPLAVNGGENDPEGVEHFWLHHGRIELPGFTARCLPVWLKSLGDEARRAGEAWLAGNAEGFPAG